MSIIYFIFIFIMIKIPELKMLLKTNEGDWEVWVDFCLDFLPQWILVCKAKVSILHLLLQITDLN